MSQPYRLVAGMQCHSSTVITLKGVSYKKGKKGK